MANGSGRIPCITATEHWSRQKRPLLPCPMAARFCVCHDITQQVTAQRGARRTETKYRMFIEQVAAISYIAEIGLNAQWYYISPQIETMFWLLRRGVACELERLDTPHPHRRSPYVIAAEEANARGRTLSGPNFALHARTGGPFGSAIRRCRARQ